MDAKLHFTIHGHFYQPPRENPWLEFIERQPSAAPYHDWNERVAAECYTPNTVSRILDSLGRIDGIVNNFEYLNFDIGPTLFAWLERHSPRTYRRIIEADARSRTRNGGHGNAVAQVFSHMIMPLADDHDLDTQIIWGVKDFVSRFNREPEGIWLAETACNERVLAALQRHGIMYTILAPSQAQSIRPLSGGPWVDVFTGNVDTRRPYRCFIKDDEGKEDRARYVDIFFFDEPLSRAMSFERLMTDSGRLADALRSAAPEGKGPQLVNAATDGETFGHHQPFADMCLASLYDHEAAARGLAAVNYAWHLEQHPPEFEVDIKSGPDDEGTAWSCAHGTGRWQRDCGCSTGGPAWWNQRWRAPLRKAFNNLRKGLDEAFVGTLATILNDPWAARNDYVDVVLDRRDETISAFLSKHARGEVSGADRMKVLRLMESQRNAMYMYTSCGWFFSELSGLEPVQNMKYAARAVELAEPYTRRKLMQSLMTDLTAAPSNIPEMQDGRNVFRRLVWPSIMTMDKIVAASVMSRLVTGKGHVWQPVNHEVETLEAESLPDRYRSGVGLSRCRSKVTGEERLFAWFATQFTARDVRCYVKEVRRKSDFAALRSRLEVADKASLPEVFEGKFISWGDLLPEVSAHIMSVLVESDLEGLRKHFTELFDQNRELFAALVQSGTELPYEIRGLVKYALSRLVHDEVLAKRGDWRPENFSRAREYVESARAFGVEIDTRSVDSLVTEDLLAEAEAVRGDMGPKHFNNVTAILEIGRQLGLSLRRDLVENIVLEMLEEKLVPWIRSLKDPEKDREDYNAIVEIIGYAEKLNFSPRRYLQMLAPFAKAAGIATQRAAKA